MGACLLFGGSCCCDGRLYETGDAVLGRVIFGAGLAEEGRLVEARDTGRVTLISSRLRKKLASRMLVGEVGWSKRSVRCLLPSPPSRCMAVADDCGDTSSRSTE